MPRHPQMLVELVVAHANLNRSADLTPGISHSALGDPFCRLTLAIALPGLAFKVSERSNCPILPAFMS